MLLTNEWHSIICSRKKKLTPHWKAYIRPHQWQIEKVLLYIHECSSQARKYDREVALLEHDKELHSKMIELDGSVSRSVPLTCQSNRRNAMKRRKRKRYEDIVDASSYISNHVFFSYYGADSLLFLTILQLFRDFCNAHPYISSEIHDLGVGVGVWGCVCVE